MQESIKPGVTLFRARLYAAAPRLLAELAPVIAAAPYRNMKTPGGSPMSVAMTNCGDCGWVTDRKGYRYETCDPLSGKPWPKMPETLREAAVQAAVDASFPGFSPNACLINRYAVGTKMGLHQDVDEADFADPIVSFSFGLSAIFLLGGATRGERKAKFSLAHGDVLVWGDAARLDFHGVAPVRAGVSPLPPEFGACRLNLTFRRA
jgi:alkylated DNA repair protein (DNA oxidative demethylase)